MSGMAIVLILTLAVCYWVYTKAMHYTGVNRTAIIATIFCGGFFLLVAWLTISTFFNK